MEMAFFFAGITSTASDQSISSNSAQSGSPAIALVISSSVSASTRAQSVLPFRRSPHFRVTIFSFFMLPRPTCRDDPDGVSPPRKDHGDQLVFQGTYCNPALLIFSIRRIKND